MGPQDELAIHAQKWKEELWAYIDEYLVDNGFEAEIAEAKMNMNDLLDTIDSFVDRPEYK